MTFSSKPATSAEHFVTLPDALEYWAATTPGRIALTEGDSELTYAGLAECVSRCRTWLRGKYVAKGDRVVIAGYNSISWIVHFLAILGLEAVIAPTNNRLNASQFADQVETLEAALVLRDKDHTELSSEVSSAIICDLEHDLPCERSNYSSPAQEASALVSFTSGTTGRPKGATLSQGTLAGTSWAFARALDTGPEDSTLVVVPLFHNAGFADQFGHMLLVGGRTDLLRKYKTSQAIEALRNRPITYLAAVPSIHRLLMLADGSEQVFQSIGTLFYGGSRMPTGWIREFSERWPDLRLYHGYGLSEYGSMVTVLGPAYAQTHPKSVGHPVPGTRVRIVGEDGKDVHSGMIGELLVTGPTIMEGYWQQPSLTANVITNGWLHTGDLARADEDGFYYVEGRVDDVINRGGEKIVPGHVEDLLSEDPAIAQSAVFPFPDPILQQRVYAAVETKPHETFDENRTRRTLREHLPDYAVPEKIFSVSSLPRTGSGKIDRRAIASRYSPQGGF